MEQPSISSDILSCVVVKPFPKKVPTISKEDAKIKVSKLWISYFMGDIGLNIHGLCAYVTKLTNQQSRVLGKLWKYQLRIPVKMNTDSGGM